MAQRVIIPTLLRTLTGNVSEVQTEAATVSELLENLDTHYPGIRARLCEANGELRRFINIYIDGEDIRFLDDLSTPVKDGAEVSIVPAIAGG